MRSAKVINCCFALSISVQSACFADGPKDYLTADGQLTDALYLRNVQGGFAGFTGRYMKIEANGDWTRGTVMNDKETVTAKGKLSAEDLGALAAEFSKFELAKLPDKEGTAGANPRVLTLKFGKVTSVITLKAAGPKAGGASDVAERALGIQRALNKALDAK